MGLVAAFTENSKTALVFAILFSLHTFAFTIAFIVALVMADSNIEFILSNEDEAEKALSIAKAVVVTLLVVAFVLLLVFDIYCALCFFSYYNELKKNSTVEEANNPADNDENASANDLA